MNNDSDYIFHEYTYSLCPQCLLPIPAKIIIKNNSVYLSKFCQKHGESLAILEEDAAYYLSEAQYAKPGTLSKTQTKISKGCPFDCGLCPDHEQHTCIALIEVTNNCNLKCPTCYADSNKGNYLSLEKIERMLDFYQEAEGGKAEVLQISGGEPTLHPQIIEIIKLAKKKQIKSVMLNTNGIRIAEDLEFVKELSRFDEGFEIYLQFDGFDPSTYKRIRGIDMTGIKKRAIDNLTGYKIPITLVATVEKGINDHELGKIFEFGLHTPFVRGVNFQPLAFFGRLNKPDINNRITMTGIIKKLEEQTNGILTKKDFIPLPCHPERVAFTFLYRKGGGFVPITRHLNAKKYLPLIKNTFSFKPEDFTEKIEKNFILSCNCFDLLKKLRPLIPVNYTLKSKVDKTKHINENTFRVSIVSFVDAYNFDMKSMKKECVHIITPDLKRIPFSSFNLIHRNRYAAKSL